jgi:adenosine deaminase
MRRRPRPLQSPEDYQRLVLAVLEESAASGVVYSEPSCRPISAAGAMSGPGANTCTRCRRRRIRPSGRWASPCAASSPASGISGPRRRARRRAVRRRRRGTGSSGSASPGMRRRAPKDFRWSFDCAREAGLRLTAHAGEWGGPEEVRDAVRDLEVERIGPWGACDRGSGAGRRVGRERRRCLEVCPGSNVTLGIYPTFRAHPIAELDRRGCKVTISTDDPPFFHTTMAREYQELHRAFDWDEGQFRGSRASRLTRPSATPIPRPGLQASGGLNAGSPDRRHAPAGPAQADA